jgi:hypothetical protein
VDVVEARSVWWMKTSRVECCSAVNERVKRKGEAWAVNESRDSCSLPQRVCSLHQLSVSHAPSCSCMFMHVHVVLGTCFNTCIKQMNCIAALPLFLLYAPQHTSALPHLDRGVAPVHISHSASQCNRLGIIYVFFITANSPLSSQRPLSDGRDRRGRPAGPGDHRGSGDLFVSILKNIEEEDVELR